VAKRFQFPLETLLKVRRLHEREAQRRVAAQQAEIARLDQLNEATRREIEQQQDALRQTQASAAIRPVDLTRGRAWIAHLRQSIAQRMALREQMVRKLEELQAQFRETRKQTRIIEKLRERRWNEHMRDQRRKEQAAVAELAQQLHSYARRSESAPASE
jgi:flagellar export protein FliJ